MIFTDGSVNDEYSGVGSCAALLIPLESCETEVNRSEVFSVLADSTEAEVCGIGLALDMAIEDLHANSNFRRIILYAAILGV